MAITKDYLNTSDLNTLATWMRTYLVPDFFAAVTFAGSTITCTDADGNTLLTFGTGIAAYKSQSASVTLSSSMPTPITYACMCANGAYMHFGTSSTQSDLIITKTNNNKTAIVYFQGNVTQLARNNFRVVAWGDTTPDTLRAYTATEANQTQFVPFCTDAALGDVSYTPNAFYIPVGQNYNVGIGKLTMDGVTYLTNGFWAIKDA